MLWCVSLLRVTLRTAIPESTADGSRYVRGRRYSAVFHCAIFDFESKPAVGDGVECVAVPRRRLRECQVKHAFAHICLPSFFGDVHPAVVKCKLCLKSIACSQGANGTPDKKANYNDNNKQTLRAVTVQQLVKVGSLRQMVQLLRCREMR